MKAKKSLGQHFLVASSTIHRIMDVCRGEAAKAAGIIEIGPGGGALTEGLLGLGKPFAAVEVDRQLQESLVRRFPGSDIRIGDASELDMREFSAGRGVSPWLVVGNLPYNVGTDILIRVLAQPQYVSALLVMLQLEVALKFCARGPGEGYGPLSAWRWPWWSGEVLFRVPPGAFSPSPKVNSAVCLMRPKQSPMLSQGESQSYRDFLRSCFASPRKTLRGNLRSLTGESGKAGALLESAGIAAGARPSAVAAEHYVKLYEIFRNRI